MGKLDTELQRAQRGGAPYALDGPTTGLHATDIEHLITQLGALVDAESSVVLINHEIAVAAASDWFIDIGPGSGDEGRRIIVIARRRLLCAAGAAPRRLSDGRSAEARGRRPVEHRH
ncbi:MAG: hypothetical protein JOZ90_03415 [Alphaproteobacteria bacterium]|nr:hypothetical protein [Alphaproteobacteria bacterium]MBV9370791.1 hypothetical protein [Alphaproteobacteria bacterium]MBV9900129.1 hypothetical protein [Alphaproteobacteria bacterium]